MDDLKLYEVGFHLLPTLSETQVGETFSKIKETIESKKGVIEGEHMATLRPLAYTMYKKGTSGYDAYQSAYFGWIYFSIDSSEVGEIKSKIEGMKEVLRLLIVKDAVIKEPKLDTGFMNAPEEEVPETAFELESRNPKKEEVSENVEVSEEALEKSIDKLTGDEEVLGEVVEEVSAEAGVDNVDNSAESQK